MNSPGRKPRTAEDVLWLVSLLPCLLACSQQLRYKWITTHKHAHITGSHKHHYCLAGVQV